MSSTGRKGDHAAGRVTRLLKSIFINFNLMLEGCPSETLARGYRIDISSLPSPLGA
jgi:hypothetical protein